jgi:tetratricopeptide (TPR) repeat protein
MCLVTARAARGVVFAVAAALVAPLAGAQSMTRVTGVVRDDTGAPIRGAVVTAFNPDSAPTTYTATTDDKGQFAIMGLRRGVWTLRATAPGYEPSEISGPIQSRQVLPPIEFDLRKTPEPGPRGALANVDPEKLRESLRSAEALAAEGKLDQALAIYEKALVQVPALTALYGEIGDLYVRKKDLDKALAAYQRMLAALPESERARAAVCNTAYALGLAAIDRHDTTGATKYLEQSIAANPESSRAAEARAALDRLKGAGSRLPE